MGNKVKVVGYAKKVFFNDGIEYRNFSPDLVGNQSTSDIGTSIFTSGNFNITTNLDAKIDKRFVTNKFSNFKSLDDMSGNSDIEELFFINKKIKLNLDTSDVTNFAFFGSLKEYIRVSLENIIINWPASLSVEGYSTLDPSITGDTVENYIFNSTTNKSTFNVNANRITNSFDINYLLNGTIIDTYNETNNDRNLTTNYINYVISNIYGDFAVTNFVGASGTTDALMSFEVEGNPFPIFPDENIDYHVKPNSLKFEEFFKSLNNFENNLLNRSIIPQYTSSFIVYSEAQTGALIESIQDTTWPTTDGYNIDFNTIEYTEYVNDLIYIAEANDSTKSDLMTRFLVSKSISEFDTIPDINGTFVDSNGQKMTAALKIYGREFDEIRQFIKGIAYANTVTYDKKNNTPDLVLKNMARIMGWDLTTSITDINLVENFLTPSDSTFDGQSVGLTTAEAELELWRRIILNTPWIWKSKGTRKAIEFLFKFIGTPDGLVTFNEYVYVAENKIDVDLLKEMMLFFNETDDISELPITKDGYPKISPNNQDMYYQKAGLWYRTTGGPNPDVDVLYGNNPHIGPYDGGQAYIDQFEGCLVPNFVGLDELEPHKPYEFLNLFTNYNNGTFDECCEGNIVASVTTDVQTEFDALIRQNIDNFINVNTVSEDDCTISSDWTIKCYLGGILISDEIFFNGSGDTVPTEQEYIDGLDVISISGATGTTIGSEYAWVEDFSSCESDLLDSIVRVDVSISTSFVCPDESLNPTANIDGDDGINCE